MSSDEKSLAALRLKIDDIDTQIHDLLMQRTKITGKIGAAKGPDSAFMRPGREATVLRRLIGRHRGPLPKALIVRIWRELFAAATSVQSALSVAVYAPEGSFGYRNLARDHYGWRTPITAYRSAAQVLEAVTEGTVTVGVLPNPQGQALEPWWRNLARDDQTVPRILARLPFAPVDPPASDSPVALAVGLARPEETGFDRGFIVLESGKVVSRSHVKEMLVKAELTVLDIQVSDEGGGRALLLVEIEGFVAEDDPRLERLIKLSEGTFDRARPIGAFAVPLSLEDLSLEDLAAPDGDGSDG